MLVLVSNASGMRVPVVAVPVTKPAAGSCRDRAGKQHKQRQQNKPAKKFPHSFPFSRNFTVAFNVCDLGRKSLWRAWGFQGDPACTILERSLSVCLCFLAGPATQSQYDTSVGPSALIAVYREEEPPLQI